MGCYQVICILDKIVKYFSTKLPNNLSTKVSIKLPNVFSTFIFFFFFLFHANSYSKVHSASRTQDYGALLFLLKDSSFSGGTIPFLMQESKNKKSYAQYNLGTLYEHGVGVLKNKKKAFYWHKKAALGGDLDSSYRIGLMYRDGVGTYVSHRLSEKWLNKAKRGSAYFIIRTVNSRLKINKNFLKKCDYKIFKNSTSDYYIGANQSLVLRTDYDPFIVSHEYGHHIFHCFLKFNNMISDNRSAYSELFADIVSVLTYKDWDIAYASLLKKSLKSEHDLLHSNQNHHSQDFLKYRLFFENIHDDPYHFSKDEKQNIHHHFTLFRSYFRCVVGSVRANKKIIIDQLLEAIKSELLLNKSLDLNLLDKNNTLIEAFEKSFPKGTGCLI